MSLPRGAGPRAGLLWVLAAALALLGTLSAGTPTLARDQPRARRREIVDAQVAIPAPPARAARTQFVLLGLDTTPHGHQRAFEELVEMLNAGRSADQPRVSFTLFIGTGSLQLDVHRRRLAPSELPFQGVLPRNMPVFHYAETLAEIEETAENIRRLDRLGVEIGSHTVRHAHGGEWSRERWDFEMEDHARILALTGLPAPRGFRAPFLDTNDGLYASLDAHGFVYDCSDTLTARRWPVRYPGSNVWVFGVPSVVIPGRDRRVVFYDLNLERRLTDAAATAGVTGTAAVALWSDEQYYEAGYAEFMRRYRGSRAPFLISGHGGFRAGTIRLMRSICDQPDVQCTTFRAAAAYLSAHPELEGAF